MPGLNLKTEVELFKKRLENIIFEINFYNKRIVLKQILFHAQDLVNYYIEYIDDFLKETEDLENLTIIQRERV